MKNGCVLISLVDTPSLRSHAVPFPSAETPRCEWSGGRWRCTQEGPSGPAAEHEEGTMAGGHTRVGECCWWATQRWLLWQLAIADNCECVTFTMAASVSHASSVTVSSGSFSAFRKKPMSMWVWSWRSASPSRHRTRSSRRATCRLATVVSPAAAHSWPMSSETQASSFKLSTMFSAACQLYRGWGKCEVCR